MNEHIHILEKHLKTVSDQDVINSLKCSISVLGNYKTEVEIVQQNFLDTFNLELEDVRKSTKKDYVVRVRQCLMTYYLLKGKSVGFVSGYFNRTHSTVIHAVKTVIGCLNVKDKVFLDYVDILAICSNDSFVYDFKNKCVKKEITYDNYKRFLKQ